MSLAETPDTTLAPVVARLAPQDALRLGRTLRRGDPLRTRLEAAVAALEGLAADIVDKLDELDGDPDLEPYLSAGARESRPYIARLDGKPLPDPGDDREDDADAEADRADDEPWLAAPEGAQHFGNLRCGGQDGREQECEDEGGQCDDEGSDTDTEPDGSEFCGWRSGEVDQRHANPPAGHVGAAYRQIDL